MKLPADATIDRAAELAASLPEAVAQADGVFEIDASAVVDYDSSTLALLMQARRLAQTGGLAFVVNGLPQQLCQLAALYGVDQLLSATPACGAPEVTPAATTAAAATVG